MSRSRRKRPFRGITTANSEKKEKRLYNRNFRRTTKQKVNDLDSGADVLPHIQEHSNPWRMEKDGKVRFDPKKQPKQMRK